MWNPNLEALLQSEVVISSKMAILVLSQVTRQQGFLTSCEWAYHIASESKIDEINTEVRNQIQPNGVRIESESNWKIWNRPSLNYWV